MIPSCFPGLWPKCSQRQTSPRSPSALHAQEVTTSYFLIRHAEKADSSKDTNLSEKGHERAAKWDRILQNISFDAVYCTVYKRTQQTAQPTANRNLKDIIVYNHKELDIPKFKKETLGKNTQQTRILPVPKDSSTLKINLL